jgi:hypothetical protein
MDSLTIKRELLDQTGKLGKLLRKLPANPEVTQIEKKHIHDMIICIDRIHRAVEELEDIHNRYLAKWN